MRTISSCNFNEPTWFVLYTSYNKEYEVKKLLECNGIECFLPTTMISFVFDNHNVKKTIPAAHGTIFARTTIDKIKDIVKTIDFIGFKVCRKGSEYFPMTVSEDEIRQMQSLSGLNNRNVTFINFDERNFTSVKQAEITDGVYSGMKGLYCNIKGFSKKYFVITAGDLCAVISEVSSKFIDTTK